MSGSGLRLRRRRGGEAASQDEVKVYTAGRSIGTEPSSASSSRGREAWRKSGVSR